MLGGTNNLPFSAIGAEKEINKIIISYYKINNMISLQFGDKIVRGDLGFIPDVPYEDALKVPEISLQTSSNGLYTLAIVDNDAPYPAPRNTMAPYVHLFIYNIPNGDIISGKYLQEYEVLNPPRDSPIHVYRALLYLQYNHLEYKKDSSASREKFPLGVLTKYSRLIESVPFTVGDPPMIDSQHQTENIISPAGSLGLSGTVTPAVSLLPLSQVTSVPSAKRGEHNFFKTGTTLTEQQKKYCSCQLKVQAGGKAYNPYAVCAKSVGTTVRSCTGEYDFNRMPDNLIQAYLDLHKVNYTGPFNRQSAIAAINQKMGY